MNEHLTEADISAWVMGDRSNTHVTECAECRIEVAAMEAALLEFRASAHELAAGQTPVVRVAEPRPWWPQLALAATAVALLLAIPAWQRAERERVAKQEAADTALLRQVDAEVSRAVPGPMEPLVSLVSWDGSNTQ